MPSTQALVIVIFVREVSRITPLTNGILLISGMMNLILPLTFRAGMVIHRHPTCDPPSPDLYSGWNLLALFIQLNNKWQDIYIYIKKERSRAIIHVSVTGRPEPKFTCRVTAALQGSPCLLLAVGGVASAAWPGSKWHVKSPKMLLTLSRELFFCNYACNR